MRGQPEGDDLAAGQRAEATVEVEVAQAQPVQLGAAALLDIPVVTDRGEHVVTGIAAGQRIQRVDDGRDAEHFGDGLVRDERQRLRQIGDGAVDTDRSAGGFAIADDQLEQRALTGAVGRDQTGAAIADGEGQVGEQGCAVGECERQVGTVMTKEKK